MNILFCIPRLETGGAEVFMIRLVKFLHTKGHRCFIFETSEYARKETPLKTQLGLEAQVFNLKGPKLLYKVIDKLDKETKSEKFRSKIVRYHLNKIIGQYQINVVNTHVFSADFWTAMALKDIKIPITITMHGCYEDPALNVSRAVFTLNRANGIIYIAEKNLKFINEHKIDKANKQIKKIYNGYVPNTGFEKTSRSQLNIATDDFVYIMVARGIEEKGWEVAIKAFTILNKEYNKTKLLLVGDSEYLQSLKASNLNRSIFFLGHSTMPEKYMELSNVGLLPTYYKNESLPNSITEYLHYSLPVITTDAGDIIDMISGVEIKAGTIVEQHSIEDLYEAMKQYLIDDNFYYSHRNNTKKCIDKFSMSSCATEYIKVFTEISADLT